MLGTGQVALAVGAVVSPWSENRISGTRDAGEVLGDAGTAVFLLLAALAIGCQVLPRRTVLQVAGLCFAAGAILLTAGLAITISGETVRAYAEDQAGHVFEPVANSRPGLGLWCAAACGLVVLGVHLARLRRPTPGAAGTRSGSPSPST